MSRREMGLALWAALATFEAAVMTSAVYRVKRELTEALDLERDKVVETARAAAGDTVMYEKIIDDQAKVCSVMIKHQIEGCHSELNLCRAALPGEP